MLEVFYYINNSNLDGVLKYGIKLSENYTKTLLINNEEKHCICGILNPKDDIEKFNSNDFTCIRLILKNANVKIAESEVFNTKFYYNTIIPITEYVLGKYISPEVLIFQSILPEDIEIINYEIDYPLLYDNSKELYTNNLIEKLSLNIENSNQIILSALLQEYSKKQKLDKDTINNVNIYHSDDEIYISNKV